MLDCLSIEGGPPANVCIHLRLYNRFYSCDLDIDRMTLIYELDKKMYLFTKNGFSRSMLIIVEPEQDSQTHRHTQGHTDRHDRTHYHTAFAGGNNTSGPTDGVMMLNHYRDITPEPALHCSYSIHCATNARFFVFVFFHFLAYFSSLENSKTKLTTSVNFSAYGNSAIV